ncbi:MAG: hypothetical protein O7I93_10475 [Gemmatimonadetes bacterium]|nr:hypothetical protein [Gemmatimonadota bacterium]
MRLRRQLLLPLLLAAIPRTAAAQSDGNAPLLLELPSSTRGLGLGGAFVLSNPDADAIFAAPGVLNSARGAGVTMQRYGSESSLLSLAAAMAWAGGGLAFGLQSLSYGMDGTTLRSVPDDASALLGTGSVTSAELVASVGYGRVIKGLQVGLVGKYIEQRIAGARSVTAAADLGVAVRELGITWSLMAQNLGPGLTIGESLPLPRRVTFGASTRSRPVGPLDLLASATVSRLRDGDIVPAGGLEISYWPITGRTFTVRVGGRRVPGGTRSPITFGAAFTGDRITIEYAFEEFDAPGAAHRFGVRWSG